MRRIERRCDVRRGHHQTCANGEETTETLHQGSELGGLAERRKERLARGSRQKALAEEGTVRRNVSMHKHVSVRPDMKCENMKRTLINPVSTSAAMKSLWLAKSLKNSIFVERPTI